MFNWIDVLDPCCERFSLRIYVSCFFSPQPSWIIVSELGTHPTRHSNSLLDSLEKSVYAS